MINLQFNKKVQLQELILPNPIKTWEKANRIIFSLNFIKTVTETVHHINAHIYSQNYKTKVKC